MQTAHGPVAAVAISQPAPAVIERQAAAGRAGGLRVLLPLPARRGHRLLFAKRREKREDRRIHRAHSKVAREVLALLLEFVHIIRDEEKVLVIGHPLRHVFPLP